METILNDNRDIQSVRLIGGGLESFFKVGCRGCTMIEMYAENGMIGKVPFVAVWFGDKIKTRFPATMAQIIYWT